MPSITKMGEIERTCGPPCVVLVINDNPYGLMCKLSLTCRFVHWHRLDHVLVSRMKKKKQYPRALCLLESWRKKELEGWSRQVQRVASIWINLKKGWRRASSRCAISRRPHAWSLPFSVVVYRWRGIKKGVPTLEEQDGLHQVQVECSRQRYVLVRASLLSISFC